MSSANKKYTAPDVGDLLAFIPDEMPLTRELLENFLPYDQAEYLKTGKRSFNFIQITLFPFGTPEIKILVDKQHTATCLELSGDGDTGVAGLDLPLSKKLGEIFQARAKKQPVRKIESENFERIIDTP